MKSCLVVDDSSVVRKVARRILEEEVRNRMHELEEAHSEILDRLLQRGDVVVLDVRMPNQRVRQVFAVRNAWAQSDPDSTKIRCSHVSAASRTASSADFGSSSAAVSPSRTARSTG